MMIDYAEMSHETCVFWLIFCILFFESWFISASFEVSQCVLLVHSQKESCCMIRKQGLCVLLESYDWNLRLPRQGLLRGKYHCPYFLGRLALWGA